jgi:hypothetical protein
MGKMEGRCGILNRLLNCRRLYGQTKFPIFLDFLSFSSSNGHSTAVAKARSQFKAREFARGSNVQIIKLKRFETRRSNEKH